MPLPIVIKQLAQARFVSVEVPVNYDDEDMPYNAPGRTGNTWRAVIDLDRHAIENWPPGVTLSFTMKVKHGGIYKLFDKHMDLITELNREYVPNELLPGSYGDYLELVIDKNGTITNWWRNPNLSDFGEIKLG